MVAIRSSFLVQSGSCLSCETISARVTSVQLKRPDVHTALSAFGNTRHLRVSFETGPLSKAVLASFYVTAGCEEAHANLVKQSYDILKKDAGTHATKFFLKIFEIAPSVKQLFSFMRDSSIPPEKNPHLKSHALVVFTMTCQGALLLGEDPSLAALRPKLLELGQTHAIYRVLDEHFDVTKFALLETLKDGLKDQWTPEMKAAWAEAFDAVASIIKEEMHAIRGD